MLLLSTLLSSIPNEILKKSKGLERGLPQVLFFPNSSQNINNANERSEPKRITLESRRSARAGSRVEEGAGLCERDGLHRIYQPNMSPEERGGWGHGWLETAVMVGQ